MLKLWVKTLVFFLITALFYLPHRYLVLPALKHKPSLEFLDFCYVFNLGAALAIILTIAVVARFSKEFLGFLFMAFGVIKLIFFVLLSHKFGFTLNRTVFLHFFFPYLCGLAIEIYFVSQELKSYNM